MNNIEKVKLKLIAEKFDIGKCLSVAPVAQGLINETFVVEANKGKYILQKLHKIFSVDIVENIRVVTEHLLTNKETTPIIIKTNSGENILTQYDCNWRMMTFVDGNSFDKIPDALHAKEAGILVGRFHNILANLEYDFKSEFKNWHNTAFYISRLKETADKYKNTKKYLELEKLKDDILYEYNGQHQIIFSGNNVVHGDLKINNLMFDTNSKALCLIDLDTLHQADILAELGDAVRSWCNSVEGISEVSSEFDLHTFEAMMSGYISENKNLISAEKLLSVPNAAAQIALELSARFLEDAYAESYFKLDKSNYKTLLEQNFTEAEKQFNLYKDINKKASKAEKIIKNLLNE